MHRQEALGVLELSHQKSLAIDWSRWFYKSTIYIDGPRERRRRVPQTELP